MNGEKNSRENSGCHLEMAAERNQDRCMVHPTFRLFPLFPRERRHSNRCSPLFPIWTPLEQNWKRFLRDIYQQISFRTANILWREGWIVNRSDFLSFFLFFLGEREKEREGRGILPWSRWCQVVRLFEYDIRRKLWDFVRGRREERIIWKKYTYLSIVWRERQGIFNNIIPGTLYHRYREIYWKLYFL